MPDLTLTPDMRVRREDKVLNTDMDDETVMMDIQQGRYFGLNETGTRIWALLAEPTAISDLCDQLVAEFDVPPEHCERVVADFLGKLLDRGLLRVLTDETS
jgi:hypothetical protein